MDRITEKLASVPGITALIVIALLALFAYKGVTAFSSFMDGALKSTVESRLNAVGK